jgi:ribosome-binding protein aMBF1 (putative translation factor)
MPTLDGSALVKKLREITGWTQKRLAEEMGKPIRTVGRWERGEYNPRLEEARRLEALLQKASQRAKKRGS